MTADVLIGSIFIAIVFVVIALIMFKMGRDDD